MAARRTFKTAADNVDELLRGGFVAMSEKLLTQFNEERGANQHNLESGVPVEDFFRQEFGALFEAPYGVDAGKIVDSTNSTCGDCDFVIFDPRLAPLLKRPAANGSRRKFFAFETTYGIIEVKQTLTLGAVKDGQLKRKPQGSLWEACTKVFAYKQLQRTAPAAVQWGSNYPFGFVFFYNCEFDLSSKPERDALLAEFALINREVKAEEWVNGVYVLDRFSLNWTFTPGAPSTTFITLQHPIDTPLRPVSVTYLESGKDTLYSMFSLVWSTLARTQLGPPDLANQYGGSKYLKGRAARSILVAAPAEPKLPWAQRAQPELPEAQDGGDGGGV